MRKLVLFGLVALSAAVLMPFAQVGRAAGNPPHVLIVLMENTSYEAVVGNTQMPYVNGLVAANGSVSTTDLSHPSEPNYLGLVSGSIQNNPQDLTPQDQTYPGPQFTDELAAAGIGWKAYMEDMPVACDLTDQYSPGGYDVNHNPFMYFSSVRGNPSQCNRDVPYPQLTADLNAGTAPPFLWVSPNTTNDMHDGTPAQGDSFLHGLVTQIQASSWWTLGSRIIITWDEGTQSDQVLTLVVGSAHGTQANGGNAYGTLRGLEEAYGVGLLGGSANPSNGDILPLLSGSTPPPPSPSPTPPTPSPSPSPSPAPSAPPAPSSPSARPSQSPSSSLAPSAPPTLSAPASSPAASSNYIRGVYGKDSSHTGFNAMATAGFTAVMTDPYKESLDPLAAAGLKGIVWLGAWLNTPTCGFENDDAKIRTLVSAIAGHPAILAYYLGDEPRITECPQAPALFKQRSDLVHSLDPGSATFTVIQAYENGAAHRYAAWVGAVDILGFDVYPCAKASSSCDYKSLDAAITAIDGLGIPRYWAIVQDFQDCYYRLPTPQELRAQFDHWSQSKMSGYFVFSWNYQSADQACPGTSLDAHPDNVAELKYENSRTFTPRQLVVGPIRSSAGQAPLWVLGAAALAVLAVLAALARRRRRRRPPI